MQGVKVNRATRQIIKRGSYPNIDGVPIPNFDPTGTGDEEWLIVNEPISRENVIYDSRYYDFITTENSQVGLHPIYTGVNQFLITYSTPKKSIDDILINLESAENNANNQAFPIEKQLKYMSVAINAVRKMTMEIPLQNYETAILTKLNNHVNAIASNYNISNTKKALIEANQEPDLDSDWTTTTEE